MVYLCLCLSNIHSSSYLSATLAVVMTERFGLRPVLITGGLFQSLGCFVASFVTTFPTLFIFIGIVNGT